MTKEQLLLFANQILTKMKNIIIITVCFILSIDNPVAQDIHFSNIDYSPLTVNPALAGSKNNAQATAQYRSQWNSVGVPFQTIAASGEMRINNKPLQQNGFLAIGVNFFNDRIGQPRINTNRGALTAAYHIKVDRRNYIGLGMNAGFEQRTISEGSGEWGMQYNGMQYDPSLSSGENFNNASFSLFTTGAGVVYSYNANDNMRIRLNESFSFRTGLSVYHLNRPNYSFVNSNGDRLLMRLSGFAKASFIFAGSMHGFDPAIYYQQQGPSREFFIGGDYKFILKEASKFTGFISRNSIAAGLFYRFNDAFVTRVLLEMSNYSVGFSYDFNASRLTEVTQARGGAEIVFRWNM